MESPSRPHGHALIVAAAYGLFLAVVGFWPRHVDANLGLVDLAFTRQLAELLSVEPVQLVANAEILANMVLFVPVGLFVALGWTRSNVWDAIATAAGISVAIEVVQWFAPIDRTGSVLDLVANIAGGCLGFAAVRASRGRPRTQAIVLVVLGFIVLGVMAVLAWGLVN